MERKHAFDEIAEEYAAVRPGYAAELHDDLAERAGPPGTARLLEIGCGPGTATLPFAERGYSITCIEHGANLVRVARRRLEGYPRVEVVRASFEEWEPTSEYDLVYAASSWHLLDEELRYDRTAGWLAPGGTLAIFAHYPLSRFADAQPAYREHAPELADKPSPPCDDRVAAEVARLDGCARFARIEVHRFPWTARHTTASYLRLLGTFSDHRVLPEARRRRLFDAIAAVIEEAGGQIERNYVTLLFTARI